MRFTRRWLLSVKENNMAKKTVKPVQVYTGKESKKLTPNGATAMINIKDKKKKVGMYGLI